MDFWFEATKGPMSMNLEKREEKKGKVSTAFDCEGNEKKRRFDALESRDGLQVIELEDDSLRSVGIRDVVPAGIRNAGEVRELGSEGIDVALREEKKERVKKSVLLVEKRIENAPRSS